MSEPVLYFGGHPSSDLPELIAAGRHPRVDYLQFLESSGARIESFEGGSSAISPSWRVAWKGRQSREIAVATGEDIGLPLALVQFVTAGRRPVNIITHGSYFGSPRAAAVFRLLRGVPWVRFLCLSESLRRRLRECYDIPESRAINVGYGIDTQFFAPTAQGPEPNLIVSAGMANRDYRTLAAAIDGMNVEARIAADSAWFRCGLDIDGQTLPPNIDVRSCGDYVGLRALYARACCVVVPLYDAVHACGYAVIAEAMAMGRPVIATRTASPSDYVIDGETGFLIPPGDADVLRARLKQLTADPDLAAWMGANARRRMERHFTLEAYTSRIATALGLDAKPGE